MSRIQPLALSVSVLYLLPYSFLMRETIAASLPRALMICKSSFTNTPTLNVSASFTVSQPVAEENAKGEKRIREETGKKKRTQKWERREEEKRQERRKRDCSPQRQAIWPAYQQTTHRCHSVYPIDGACCGNRSLSIYSFKWICTLNHTGMTHAVISRDRICSHFLQRF